MVNASQTDFVPEPAAVTKVVSASGGANPTGGTGTYAYFWELVSGDPSITINNAYLQSPTWSATVSKNTTKEAVWKCTVTSGSDTVSGNSNVSLSYITDY